MILEIIQEPSAILRKKSEEVLRADFGSPKLKKIIKDMSDTLRSIEVGVGLAAPQISRNIRLFIISEEAKDDHRREEVGSEKYKVEHQSAKHLVFINPRVKKFSKKSALMVEGCLSVNDPEGEIIYGKVKRAEKITVEALNEYGKKIQTGAKGLFAQVLQHELDHLDGVLFIDKALELKKIKKDKTEV